MECFGGFDSAAPATVRRISSQPKQKVRRAILSFGTEFIFLQLLCILWGINIGSNRWCDAALVKLTRLGRSMMN